MSRPTTLRQSLAIQSRVMRALFLREVITRFGRQNIGVLWLVAEPMIFTLGVTALWSLGQMHTVSQIPIVAFAITGYSSVLMWRNTVGRASSAIRDNQALLYHRNVRLLDVLLTRVALEMSGATASFIVLACFFTGIEWISPPKDLLPIFLGWGMLAWFGAALSILIGAATSYSEIVDRIWHPAAYLLFPLSGAGFMVDWLPPAAQQAVLYLPMVHGVEMVREGYFGDVVRTHYDVGYVAFCNMVLTLAGLTLLRSARHRVGQHG